MSKIISVPVSMIGSHIMYGDTTNPTFPVGSIVYTNISGSTYANAVIASGSFAANGTALPTTIIPNTTFTYGTASNLVCLGKVNIQTTTAWVSGTAFTVGQLITNVGNTYYVTTAGSSTTGPTNTSGASGALAGGTLVVSYVSASTAWVSGTSYSANTVITHAGNMYLVTTTGSSTTAPTNTSGSSGVLAGGTGTLVVSYIAKATVSGTQWTASRALVANNIVYWAGNLYGATGSGSTDASVAPTHTSGTVTNGTVGLKFIASYYSPGVPWISGVTYPQYSLIYNEQSVYVVTASGSSTSAPSGVSSETLRGGDGNLSVQLICNIGSKYVMNIENIVTVQPSNTYGIQIKYLSEAGQVTNLNVNIVSPDTTYGNLFSIMDAFDKMAKTRNSGSNGIYSAPLTYSGSFCQNPISCVFMT